MKTKVNLNKREINVSDLNDSHLIGMEYENNRRESVKRTDDGDIGIGHDSLSMRNSTITLITANTIEGLLGLTDGTTGQSASVRAVYIFDTPEELKKWLTN